jgi:hypothetical protein
MSAGETTTDHDVIRHWIEERGGKPAFVAATEDNGRSGGLLRVDFQNPDGKFDDIEWDEFFKVFDDNKLAFLHQDKTADGSVSRFNKFVSRENA